MSNTNPVVTQFTGDAKPFFAELNKVRNELGGFRKDVAGIAESVSGLLEGYLGFEAVKGAIHAVIDATAEALAAQAQLNSALAAAGAPVKAASAEFQAYAAQLQETSTFSAVAVQGVETLLLSFNGLSGHIIKEATAAVLDLSTRMGIDAPAAAKLLGKALSDPVEGLTALRRAGVIFTQGQKEQIKAMQDAGDAAGAQALILKDLEERFGGAAEAARNTFGGALTGLKNSFNDLLEGGSGFNAATVSINHLTDVLSSPQTKAAFEELITDLAKVIDLAAQTADGLAILFTDHGGNASVDIDLQIEKLEKQRKALLTPPLSSQEGPIIEIYSKEAYAADQKRIAEIDEQLRKLHDQQAQLLGLGEYGPGGALADVKAAGKRSRPKGGGPLDFTTGGDDSAGAAQRAADAAGDQLAAAAQRAVAFDKALADQIVKDQAAVADSSQKMSEAGIKVGDDEVQRAMERDAFFAGLRENSLDQDQMAADQRYALEKKTQDSITALRVGAANSAVGLLEVLARKHKAAAIALILVNKAQAIALAVQNTAAAVTNVMATTPVYSWPAGIAEAEALGALQIGLIAATGALEISSLGHSGGGYSAPSLGTPSNTVYNQGDSPQYGASAQKVLQVHFNGPVYGMDDFRQQLINMLRDEVSGTDVVFISGTSRQAMEIRGHA